MQNTRRGRRHVANCALPAAVLSVGCVLAACQPTVQVQAPKEPITVNLNIKLDADVRVKLEDTAREDISQNKKIF